MSAIRPMREDDIPAVIDLDFETFDDLARRRGEPLQPRPDLAVPRIIRRHMLRTDPGGVWVAVDEQGLAGCAFALKREGVWGLALLVVRPDRQSSGVGRALLEQAHGYAEGARGRIVLSSADARAIRAYTRLGLQAHPSLVATGTPRDVSEPEGIREGGVADIPLTEAVDRHVRGAARGTDVVAQLAAGHRLLVAPERGYAVASGGSVRMLGAFDEDAARDLLRAVLAGTEDASVLWLTAAQQWAIEVCVDARLDLNSNSGVVFLDGDVGAFHPYIPSGAFL
jgi:GNAT superfamily N-acetyltransferase